jgi:Domain of unknown function (DUF1906)
MDSISRRQFHFGATALSVATCMPTFAQERSASLDGRIAIIDTDDDSRKLLSEIKNDSENKGIAIVARYYSRACQPDQFPFKRIAFHKDGYVCGDNHWKGPPEHELLLGKGLAILSAYQYNSSSPSKFLFGLSDVQTRIQKSNKPLRIAAPEVEAEADASAALEQAQWIRQPQQSAIYFGVDFNLTQSGWIRDLQGRLVMDQAGRAVESRQTVDAVLTYFSRLKSLIGDRVGAYGNGFANRILREHGFIKYSWVSESRSFLETPQYLSDSNSTCPWHLFQNQIDRRWFAKPTVCKGGFVLDTLVQNPNVTDIGAWNANGQFELSPTRTQQIFKERWVATHDNIAVFADTNSGKRLSPGACRETLWESPSGPQRNRSVRVVRDLGDWIEVDIDDDGMVDGFCQKKDPVSSKKNFVESIFMMPKW